MTQNIRVICQADESPGSVILRAVSMNLLRVKDILAARYKGSTSFQNRMTQLIKLGFDISSHVGCDLNEGNKLDLYADGLNHRSAKNLKIFSFAQAKYCSDCCTEGYFYWGNDVHMVEACVKHGRNLIMHCPFCKESLSWTRNSLGDCKCGAKLPDSSIACKTSLAVSTEILEFVEKRMFIFLEYYYRLARFIEKDYGIKFVSPRQIFDVLSGNLSEHATNFLRELHRVKNVPAPFCFARFALKLTREERTLFNSVLMGCLEFKQDKKIARLDKSYQLRAEEVVFSIGLGKSEVESLFQFNAIGQNKAKTVSLGEVMAFLENFDWSYSNPSPAKGLSVSFCADNANGLQNMLENLKSEQLFVPEGTHFYFASAWVEGSSYAEKNKSNQFLTLREASSYIGTGPHILGQLARLGLIKYKKVGKTQAYRFDIEDLDNFTSNYILSSKIATLHPKLGKKIFRVFDQLGIKPIEARSSGRILADVYRISEINAIPASELIVAQERGYCMTWV